MRTRGQGKPVDAAVDFSSLGITTGKKTGERVRPTRDEIERRAYEEFVLRGRADGHDVDDWLVAERELKHHYSVS